MTSTRPPFPIAGHWPALLTPVDSAGRIDQPRLLAQARRMLAAGASGVTLFGTSGEGPAFAVAARQAALDALLAAGIAPSRLIVTLTASALPDAIALGRDAVARQCAGTLLMPPYYFNRPRDAGVVAAVSAVVDALDPVGCANLLLYQFPSLSNVSFSHAAIAELSRRHPEQIVGIKDSTGDLAHSLRLIRAFPALA
ncbi:MAG: dihydrodipicolinate synthase family protein, partial [Lautropia sp.]